VKLSDLRKNVSELKIGNDDQLQKLHFPVKSMYFIKDGNKLESAPRSPNSTQTRFTTDDGTALAMSDPRKAKYFGIQHSTLRLG